MLRLDHVSLSFEGLKAVNDVSITINPGEVTAIIGPNGAGKTTLFNLIAGVYTPDSGTITLENENITGLKPYVICKKGITRTYQVIKLFTGMSAIDNILVGMHSRLGSSFFSDVFKTRRQRTEEKKAKEKAFELLGLVGLKGYESFTAGNLAYGQQRLLEIARSMASDPKLLLLDEPAAGMNSAEKQVLNDRIREIINRGFTVLIVEHDMNMVMSIADRIIVINSGKLLAEGTPSEISTNPDVIEAYLGKEE